MDLNVKVGVRCRPLSPKEIERGCSCIVSMTDKTVQIKKTDDELSQKDFTFDHCYFTDSTQDAVYRDLGFPLLSQAMEGFNGTIFAYGQTGAGKSHSMTGTSSDKGIVPRLNDDLWRLTQESLKTFRQSSDGATGDSQFMITVSFLEIYNEVIKDLLNPRDNPLKIRENASAGIYVEGLCELIVRSPAELLKLIDQGNTVRRVAATNMNDQSSRSHSCFTIKIEKKTTLDMGGGVTRENIVKAKLNLVDLAGSERASKTGASGATLKEGANINMSLMALGNVINALSEGSKKFIPYRDSKLTRLLQESLGGNALTVMLAAISPADYNYDETVGTLKYANRAKSIANAVTKNEDSTERMIKDLQSQIEQLKQQLHSGGDPEANAEVQKKLQEMELSQQDAWAEKERLSRALEEERQANMNTVISNMMSTVKEQKLVHMKAIKRLSNEKTSLTTHLKDSKDLNVQLKARLDANMKKYLKLQGEYEEMSVGAVEEGGNAIHGALIETMAAEMATVLSTIESDRSAWIQTRDDLKQMKARLTAVEDELTTERAELVATAGLLDQNDKLRAQIQEEEREKAKEMIASELAVAKEKLDVEREQVRGSLQEEMRDVTERYRAQLDEQQMKIMAGQMQIESLEIANKELDEEVNKMQMRLAESEVNQEAAQNEVTRLAKANLELPKLQQRVKELTGEIELLKEEAEKRLLREKSEAQEAIASTQLRYMSDSEQEKYKVFRSLMDAFAEERSDMDKKLRKSQSLFANAVQDMMFLATENDELRASLVQAIKWEPPIRNHVRAGTTDLNKLPAVGRSVSPSTGARVFPATEPGEGRGGLGLAARLAEMRTGKGVGGAVGAAAEGEATGVSDVKGPTSSAEPVLLSSTAFAGGPSRLAPLSPRSAAAAALTGAVTRGDDGVVGLKGSPPLKTSPRLPNIGIRVDDAVVSAKVAAGSLLQPSAVAASQFTAGGPLGAAAGVGAGRGVGGVGVAGGASAAIAGTAGAADAEAFARRQKELAQAMADSESAKMMAALVMAHEPSKGAKRVVSEVKTASKWGTLRVATKMAIALSPDKAAALSPSKAPLSSPDKAGVPTPEKAGNTVAPFSPPPQNGSTQATTATSIPAPMSTKEQPFVKAVQSKQESALASSSVATPVAATPSAAPAAAVAAAAPAAGISAMAAIARAAAAAAAEAEATRVRDTESAKMMAALVEKNSGSASKKVVAVSSVSAQALTGGKSKWGALKAGLKTATTNYVAPTAPSDATANATVNGAANASTSAATAGVDANGLVIAAGGGAGAIK